MSSEEEFEAIISFLNENGLNLDRNLVKSIYDAERGPEILREFVADTIKKKAEEEAEDKILNSDGLRERRRMGHCFDFLKLDYFIEILAAKLSSIMYYPTFHISGRDSEEDEVRRKVEKKRGQESLKGFSATISLILINFSIYGSLYLSFFVENPPLYLKILVIVPCFLGFTHFSMMLSVIMFDISSKLRKSGKCIRASCVFVIATATLILGFFWTPVSNNTKQ